MQIIKGDILTDINKVSADIPTVIIHGCNCFHTMGAGIARYLSRKYPAVLRADKTQTEKGDFNKLGTYSIAEINENLVILNCYTQYMYKVRPGDKPVDYEAIALCLKKVRHNFNGWLIRSPKIGCGLAGGSWPTVRKSFHDLMYDQQVEIYYL